MLYLAPTLFSCVTNLHHLQLKKGETGMKFNKYRSTYHFLYLLVAILAVMALAACAPGASVPADQGGGESAAATDSSSTEMAEGRTTGDQTAGTWRI